MNRYIYAPEANQLDGIMQPINPLMGANTDAGVSPDGWQPMYQSWALSSAAQDSTRGQEGWQPMYQSWALAGIDDVMSPMIRSDIATPTVDIKNASNQFAMPALNGGMGAVQDALSVLAVVDLLAKG